MPVLSFVYCIIIIYVSYFIYSFQIFIFSPLPHFIDGVNRLIRLFASEPSSFLFLMLCAIHRLTHRAMNLGRHLRRLETNGSM